MIRRCRQKKKLLNGKIWGPKMCDSLHLLLHHVALVWLDPKVRVKDSVTQQRKYDKLKKDLESYEEMREGIERSEMGVEDVRLPMPAVRQEYGQRASLRIAGARGTFNRNFSSYDRVPLESRYPGLAPSQELRRSR